MRIIFKITRSLLADIRQDLMRTHPFAHERVGFISTGLSAIGRDIVVLARGYQPVHDDDYLDIRSVGAMMGPNAIRKALQLSMQSRGALFHVHTHGGRGLPRFSHVDICENVKFVPDFFKVAPQCAHGAIVLSNDAARGQVWLDRKRSPVAINSFIEVGQPITKWCPA